MRILTENSEERSVRCEITGTVLSVRCSKEKAAVTVRAGEEAGKLLVYLEPDDPLPLPGSVVQLSGRTELFDPALNPGGFSYRDYYDSIGVFLRFRADSCRVLSSGNRMAGYLYQLRDRLALSIEDHADPEDAGILRSMLLSDSSGLDTDERNAFSFLGLLQLVSLSGLQLVFTGSLIFDQIRKKTGKKLPAFFTGLTAVLILSFFTGFSMSSLRAVVIYCMRAGAVMLKRHFDFVSACALSLILILLETPRAVFTSGFQFMAGILFGAGVMSGLVLRCLRVRDRIFRGIFTALSVQTIMLPVKLSSSFGWSLLSPVLYALFLPVSGLIFVLGFLGTAIGLLSDAASSFILGAEHYFIRFLRVFTEFGKGAGGLTWITGCPDTRRVLIYYLICAAAIAGCRRILDKRKLLPETDEPSIHMKTRVFAAGAFAAFLVFGLLFLKPRALADHTAEILMIDCGQGDAFLIRTSGGTVILSDAGSSSDDRFYQDQLSGVLRYYGIRTIDYAVVSHPDSDHISGLAGLLSEGFFSVDYLIYAEAQEGDEALQDLLRLSEDAGTKLLPASAGNTLGIPDGKLSFLWPEKDFAGSVNEASLVFLMEYEGRKALFTGDISAAEEQRIRNVPDLDVLKVAHHGSRFSSSDAFLSASSPEIALISCGKNNSYGHPAPETLKRLAASGAEVLITRHEGAVSILLSASGILAKRLY